MSAVLSFTLPVLRQLDPFEYFVAYHHYSKTDQQNLSSADKTHKQEYTAVKQNKNVQPSSVHVQVIVIIT